ncbi:hypothetical protein CC2G_001855 [Coprinopsis cinerea AmutBmut pab1-1]|nr:hypothetical protein CC2G_001855 [Coprinopsis cinerea AmutBmut pab1-1]
MTINPSLPPCTNIASSIEVRYGGKGARIAESRDRKWGSRFSRSRMKKFGQFLPSAPPSLVVVGIFAALPPVSSYLSSIPPTLSYRILSPGSYVPINSLKLKTPDPI